MSFSMLGKSISNPVSKLRALGNTFTLSTNHLNKSFPSLCFYNKNHQQFQQQQLIVSDLNPYRSFTVSSLKSQFFTRHHQQQHYQKHESWWSKKRMFSQKNNSEESFTGEETITKPIVGYWYLLSGSLVFGIVVLGGLTRLTESGLSITEWNVIRGMKYPGSTEEWDREFLKYKHTPEYKLLNHNISMEEFQNIFFMEWAHRMWGRLIGLAFIIPGAYFAYRGYMSKAIQKRSLMVATMIGGQGLLGWYMVKSGLDEQNIKDRPIAVPRVSQYRLTAHLGSAFIIYSFMLMTGLGILRANKVSSLMKFKDILTSPKLSTFRTLAKGTAGLVFVTAMSGAFVAGLDAGLIYNEFPFMGESIFPSDYWALSTSSQKNPNPLPWYKDLLENPAAVQFDHRALAISTLSTITGLWMYSRKLPLPPASRLAINALMAVAAGQVTLGITTLIYFVPVPLAAAHQAGSLGLLSVALYLVHTLKRLPK